MNFYSTPQITPTSTAKPMICKTVYKNMTFSDAMIAILEQDAGSNVHHCMPRSAKLPNLNFFCQAGHNETQIRKIQIKISMFNSFAISEAFQLVAQSPLTSMTWF